MPIFIGLYSTLNVFLQHGVGAKTVSQINGVLYTKAIAISQVIDPQFLGFNLALSPQKAGIWFYYLIPVLTGVLQYFQAVATTAQPAQKVENKKL